jgi:hypothetical protein
MTDDMKDIISMILHNHDGNCHACGKPHEGNCLMGRQTTERWWWCATSAAASMMRQIV